MDSEAPPWADGTDWTTAAADRTTELDPSLTVIPEEGITVSGSVPEMPHWSDPPTGEVPRLRFDDDADDDDTEVWRADGGRGVRWRDDGGWDDDEDLSALVEADEDQPGALDQTRSEHSDLYSFDEDFERVAASRTGSHPVLDVTDDGDDDEWVIPAPPGPARRSRRAGGGGGGESRWRRPPATRRFGRSLPSEVDDEEDQPIGAPAAGRHRRTSGRRLPGPTDSGERTGPAGAGEREAVATGAGSRVSAGGARRAATAAGGAEAGPAGAATVGGARLGGSATVGADTRRGGAATVGAGARRAGSATGGAGVRRGGTASAGRPGAPDRSREFSSRLFVGVGLIVLLIICAVIGPAALVVLSTVVVTAAAAEAYNMTRAPGFRPATLLGLVATIGCVLGAYWRGIGALPVVTVLLFAGTMLWYVLGVVEARPLANAAVTVMVFVWVSLLGSFSAVLLEQRSGEGLFIGAVLVAVAADVFAFGVGRWIGSRPMAAGISPNKTIEGFIGGVVGALIVGAIVGKELHPWGGMRYGLLLGLVVGLIAPVGDLFESMLKRDLGLKDSGRVLGGHGGVLDRFDALLLALPAAYFVATIARL